MSDESCILPGFQQKDTNFGYTLSIISGKYKMTILYYLSENKIVRFNELQRGIGTIPFKTLSVMLKELEADSLVRREKFPQIPPKVEYSLTERGQSLIPVMDMMCTWGEENFVSAVQGTTRPFPI
ncbi:MULTISPECIES: winged helix-turn-helix transcriptional regulator [Paenibacillus]|uniref:Transcriptional regulator n=1 Tax=Paenibacillus borealis TaxID=160799 RepID=A0ABX3HI29_PAEBO|nr:helix-turn-helix domain-containing protein [Paenibacillus borealis]OMD50259.1 transcriptional regulator [Paenibacillus borealis]